MIKNSLIIISLILSVNAFAQEIPDKLLPKVKENNFNKFQLKDSLSITNLMDVSKTKNSIPMIALPNAKPKDISVYAALKGKVRNDQLYPILNAIPEKEWLSKK